MGMSEILTVKEVAELLKTSRVQVRKMIQSGYGWQGISDSR